MKLKLDANGNVVLQDGKPVYVHDDGKEVAFDAPGTVANISRLNREAQGNRERYEAAETKLKAFAGIEDPEAAIKALTTIKNIDDKKLVDSGQVEQVRAAAIKATEDKYQGTIKALTDQVNVEKASNAKITGEFYAEKIGGSFNRSKLITEKLAIPVDMVQAKFGGNFKIEDGKTVAYDNSGNKIFSRTRPGDIADFDEALEALVDQYPHKDSILKGTTKEGGGATNQGGGAGGKQSMKRTAFEALSPAEKQATIAAKVNITD